MSSVLIGELAARTGVSARALRHYDRLGLLPSRRKSNRYRDFAPEAVEGVRRIRLLLGIGLDLGAVKHLLLCFTGDGRLGGCPHAREQLSAQISRIEESMASLRKAKRMLTAALTEMDQLRHNHHNGPGSAGVI